MNYTPNYHLPTWAMTDRIQMADFNDMTAKLDTALKTEANARSAGDLYVRLADQTLSSAKQQMDISLSGLGQYHQLDVRITPVTGSGCPTRLMLRVNNIASGYRGKNDSSDSTELAILDVGQHPGNCCFALVRIYLTGGIVAFSEAGYRFGVNNTDTFYTELDRHVRHLPLSPGSVQTLNVLGSGANLPAGTRVQVYGYRK